MDIVWIPVAIVILALGAYAAMHLFGGGKRQNLAKDAEARARDVRTAAEAALAVELESLEVERQDLEGIKGIKNDAERLRALADFANRRRKR